MTDQSRRGFLGGMGVGVAAAVTMPHVGCAESSDRIKIGQIGTTHAHAGGKMSTMRKFSDHFEVVGVVEPDAKRRSLLSSSSTYRDVPVMTEEQLLNTPGLQAVAVETEVRDLLPAAMRCAKAGLHIHLDKPAGESLDDFEKVLNEATRRNKIVQMGYMYRYNPGFQLLFKAIRDGWIGDVFELHGVMSKKVAPSTRKQLARYRGGTMFELGCHIIDAMVAAIGKPAKTHAFTRRTRPDLDNLADNQLAVFEYPKCTATIRSAVVEVNGGRRRQFVVCGDKGTVEIYPLEPPAVKLTLEVAAGGHPRGTSNVQLPKLEGRYDGDFLDLAKIVRGEKKSDFPPVHDLAVQEAVLRASDVMH